MKLLNFLTTTDNIRLQRPLDNQSLTLDSSALEAFDDLSGTNPLLVDAGLPAVEAARMMRRSHTKWRFVVNRSDQCLGVLLLQDLNDQNLLRKQTAGYERELMTAGDFMRRKTQLKSLSYAALAKASVRHLVDAMDSAGMQHCLVVDDESIRGFIDIQEVLQRLNTPTRLHHSPSFHEIYRAVEHS